VCKTDVTSSWDCIGQLGLYRVFEIFWKRRKFLELKNILHIYIERERERDFTLRTGRGRERERLRVYC
jgi:hypothetical protein